MGGLALQGQPAQVPCQAGMGVLAPHWQGASRHSVSSWFSLTAWQISAPSSSSGHALRGSSCVTSECPGAMQGRGGGSPAAPRGAAPKNGLGQGQPQGEVGGGAAVRTHWADGVALEGLWGSWGESARVGGAFGACVCPGHVLLHIRRPSSCSRAAGSALVCQQAGLPAYLGQPSSLHAAGDTSGSPAPAQTGSNHTQP